MARTRTAPRGPARPTGSGRTVPGPAAVGLVALVLVTALAVAAAVHGFREPRASLRSSSEPALPSASPSASSSPAPSPSTAAEPPDTPRGDGRDGLRAADGLVPAGTTVFDDGVPAVSGLDPELLEALRRATADAADAGVVFHVNSGWRSPAYQDLLLREAVAEHGSEEEAARWVATSATSPHVAGEAVDLGPSAATAWLSEHGAGYGLCQVYRNEPWHYELRPEAADRGCPDMYADPAQDPRMQR
ncbi:M15 family metallopeptidase [Nocardiopsis sp. NPDC057823]|uniref:M15 family metallopeptidase n=1 Tax=Nocardiopsis sp. NPDC057823 TaxID=3346256 RepID=UPI00366A7EA6